MATNDIETHKTAQIEAALGTYVSDLTAAGCTVHKADLPSGSGVELVIMGKPEGVDQQSASEELIGDIIFKYEDGKVRATLTSSTGDTMELPGSAVTAHDIVEWLRDPLGYKIGEASKAA